MHHIRQTLISKRIDSVYCIYVSHSKNKIEVSNSLPSSRRAQVFLTSHFCASGFLSFKVISISSETSLLQYLRIAFSTMNQIVMCTCGKCSSSFSIFLPPLLVVWDGRETSFSFFLNKYLFTVFIRCPVFVHIHYGIFLSFHHYLFL